ncbi:hypothetical protein J4H92_07370 [Leucobacter weissii]|uniref:Aminoglycoside phosphotransferase domain-containing protein n=1 Tax=Leucobacter weissii TaxID=1983706 RepID=A0A939MIX1_9MICO|nr:phosphotransferase [Leucobacter weissii]MBO1901769.1 hypothetical protein [Leucobacter weissii]
MSGQGERASTAGSPRGAAAASLAELELLREALGIGPEAVSAVSREPLGAGSAAGFDVSVDADDSAPARLRYYVDTSRLAVERETGLALGAPDGPGGPDARIWLHPADPHLPALPAVAFHGAAEALLARIGVSGGSAPEFVAYRPGRRAVLRIDTADGTVWVKVVRPRRAERIAAAHAACDEAGLPTPAVLGWSPAGVLLLADADGIPAASADWEPDDLLDRVARLRESIAEVETSAPNVLGRSGPVGAARSSAVPTAEAVRGIAERLDWYADRFAGSERAARIAARARAILDGESGRAATVVHGDLHFGQLFLGPDGSITGLVDVDTLGVGDPGEDPAAFLGHAVASALLTVPERRRRVWDLADRAAARWAHDSGVRARFAVHMLGHALAAADRDDPPGAARLLGAAEAVLRGDPPSGAPQAADEPKNALTRPLETV